MIEISVIFAVCTFSGFLTGLLGLGGGLVIIPAFLAVLPLFGINYDIHQIIGISAACVFVNSSMSVFYRRNEKFMQKKIITGLGISIIIGTLTGAYLSSFAPREILLWIFTIISVLSIFLINNDFYYDLTKSKYSYLIYPIFAGIGAISASIGIGGALLFATALKCFTDKNAKELLPTITLLVLIHAFFAFLGKLSVGNVTWVIIPIALPASMIGAKIGVIISKKLSPELITKLMSITLGIALLKVIFELF